MMMPRLGRWRILVDAPRVVDGALVLACLVLTAFAVKAHWSMLPRPVIALAGVAGSVAQWPRRRRPVLAVIAGAAAYALSGNPVPLLVGLYSGASYGRRRHTWAVAVVGAAGFAGWEWIDSGRLRASDAEYAVFAAALVVAVGMYAATRRALTASWRDQAERAGAERLLRDEQARSAERTRIAREMHDVLAHKVSLIALHAGALELAGGDPARVRQGAGLIRVTAREALQELRTVLGVLQAEPAGRPSLDGPAEPGEPFADLASLVRASTQAGQLVELRDRAGALPPNTARVVYRVTQEGLTNARKHAPGAPTTVSVNRGDDGNVTVIVDNESGSGAPMDLPGSGSGLVGLAERIRLAGGTLHSGPSGAGWRLRAVIPWLDQHVERLVHSPDEAR